MAADLFQFSLDNHDITLLSEDPAIVDEVSLGLKCRLISLGTASYVL